jgi:hypothetical protein
MEVAQTKRTHSAGVVFIEFVLVGLRGSQYTPGCRVKIRSS